MFSSFYVRSIRTVSSLVSAVVRSRGGDISTMAVPTPCSRKSPFSHIEMYGVVHPVIGRLTRSTNRSSKAKSLSHKLSAVKSKKGSSSVRVSSVTRGYSKKKKKEKETPQSKQPRKERSVSTVKPHQDSHIQTSIHSKRDPGMVVAGPPSGLARVDSPCQISRRSSTKGSSWRKVVQPPSSETTSGYSTDKSRSQHSNSRNVMSDTSLSVISHSNSTISTSDVLLSLSESQDNLKSKIINSPINVSLKRASQTGRCLPPPAPNRGAFTRPFSSSTGLKSRHGVKPGSRGERLTVEDIVWGLGRLQYKSVIVMSGAGISTSSGIPDFRTPGTGLYDNLQQYRIPDPMAIFDIGFFSRNPKPFFTLAKELYPGKYQPNTVHHFVCLLQEKGILLRNYTQNIDGLERIAGISPSKLVEAHGSFSTASCIKCKSKQESAEVKAAIFSGKVPRCKHKYCVGLVKPDIVFFGEDLPARFHSLQMRDFSKCDLLIIMGTSLEVEPFASLCTLPRFNVPRLLINRELVGPFKHGRKRMTDVSLTGDLVDSVTGVIEGAGWVEDLHRLLGEPTDEVEIVRASSSIDVQTVASEDSFSHISTESEPAILSPTFSDSTVPGQDNTDTSLATRMAGLKFTGEEGRDSQTQSDKESDSMQSHSQHDNTVGLSHGQCDDVEELKWRISRKTDECT